MPKLYKPEYLAKVKLLTQEDAERLLSRMTGKLPRRLEKDKLSKEEALAIQMELEDDQLHDWRKMMHMLKKKDEEKEKEKAKEKTKETAPTKPPSKSK
jgi:hypothetical protein